MADEQPGASSAPAADSVLSPVDQAVVSGDVASFREARRQARAGTPSLSSSAESTPAEPAVQAASTDASSSPASEPGKPAKRNAETRIQELLRERHDREARIAALERELAARRPAGQPQTPAAESSPAAATPTRKKFMTFEEWSQRPDNAGRDYEDYTDDRIADALAQQRATDRADAERAQRQQAETAELQTYRQRAEAFVAKTPDYWTAIQPVVSAPPSETNAALEAVIRVSEVGPQILYHLGTHLEEFQRLIALPPPMSVYELGKLEATLTVPPVAAVTRKATTSAPAPPTTLGSKAADPGNEIDAAVASGDMVRFKELRQRQRAAALSAR